MDLVLANLPYLPLAERRRYPDLSDEPVEAAFAWGDGLGPYRRLLAAAEERLVPGGVLALQLHGCVESATREELQLLRRRIVAPADDSLAVAV